MIKTRLQIAVALAATLTSAVVFAAPNPKAVDVSQGRTGVGQKITFIGIDKINSNAQPAASSNARVRFLASCAQSALKCASTNTGGDDGVTPPGNGDDPQDPVDGNDDVVDGSDGDVDIGGEVVDGGNGLPGGSPLPDLDAPSLVSTLALDTAQAAACVQDESFCKDANLKRVANRNSVIDEIFFYTEL